MESLLILATKGTPRVEFHPEGKLSIKGRCLPLDPIRFFNPILEWLKKLTAPTIHFLIRLEYINTSSAQQLKIMLQLLKDNAWVKSLNIEWYYEEDDEDSYNTGREFEYFTKLQFQFHEFSDDSE